jgi:hypothetical protein
MPLNDMTGWARPCSVLWRITSKRRRMRAQMSSRVPPL